MLGGRAGVRVAFETVLNTGSETKGRKEREGKKKNQENINAGAPKFVASARM